jgi:hypothetical protein
MKTGRANSQRGAALLALLAVIGLGASWLLLSQLNAESSSRSAALRAKNAEVLKQAKQMLIGHVAMQAAKVGEYNPGRLACPEPDGIVGGDSEGGTNGNCTLPAIGRFPWRTFGADKLVDAAGEPLWYVVSPGWALSNSTTPPETTYINSNSHGQLLVNPKPVTSLTQAAGTAMAVSAGHGFRTGEIVKIAGASPAGYNVAQAVTVIDANRFTFPLDSTLPASATGSIKAGEAVVALIIAPGSPIPVPASAICTARNQGQFRSIPSSTINALDYLECFDAANGVFSTTGPSGAFNDHVAVITAADLMPGIEAVVANRIRDEIVPALKTVYTHSAWGFTTVTPPGSPNNPVLPFAAPFANPGPGAGTSNYRGTLGNYQGLLPFNQTQNCNPATDPRCTTPGDPAFLAFSKAGNDIRTAGSGSISTQSTCSWQSNVYVCAGQYQEPSITVTIRINIANVAMGLRALDHAAVTIVASNNTSTGAGPQNVPASTTVVLNADGSATLNISGTLPVIDDMGWGTYAIYTVRIDRSVLGDHALVDPNAAANWFSRNEWYRLVYYATPRSNTAAQLPGERSCATALDCLAVANLSPTADSIAPLLILAGRSTNGTARPNAALANYLEGGNETGAFVRNPVNSMAAVPAAQRFNDRIIVLGRN